MFDLSDRPLVWIPVKWTTLRKPEPDPAPKGRRKKPADDGEEPLAIETEVSVELEVELLDRDQIPKLLGDLLEDDKGETDDTTELSERERELRRFMRVVKNWRKLKNGPQSVPFNEDNARLLLAVPGFISSFETAYLGACAGKADIRRGN
jgi:hypothetical protein